jgi:hypothetical protein
MDCVCGRLVVSVALVVVEAEGLVGWCFEEDGLEAGDLHDSLNSGGWVTGWIEA